MTKLAKWHVEEILENFVLGGFPVKDDDRFLACSSILTSMIDTVEVDEPNKAFISIQCLAVNTFVHSRTLDGLIGLPNFPKTIWSV